MKCPYCGGEMTSGDVSAPDNAFEFYPAGVKPNIIRSRWEKTEGAVTIMDFIWFRKGSITKHYYPCPAHYCPACRKIVLDLAETNPQP